MQQKILCISGRKQAGKDTCFKFLRNLFESFDPPHEVRQFYYAEPLKRLCVDILGCPEHLVYGSDADKNTLVPHLLWENFPVTVLKDARSGPMSVREALQYWGSEIFRRQYEDVWADACIRAIHKSEVPFAVITDCRFPNEVHCAQAAEGYVVRLDRVVFPDDAHTSETSLDPDKFDWQDFNYVIHNAEMTIEEQCHALYFFLYQYCHWLPYIPHEEVVRHARRASA